MRIIKFSALWCPSCLIVNSRINKIVGKYNIDIVEYDYDIDEDMVSKYNVESILPVIIFINNDGLEVKRVIGEVSLKELIKIVEGELDE